LKPLLRPYVNFKEQLQEIIQYIENNNQHINYDSLLLTELDHFDTPILAEANNLVHNLRDLDLVSKYTINKIKDFIVVLEKKIDYVTTLRNENDIVDKFFNNEIIINRTLNEKEIDEIGISISKLTDYKYPSLQICPKNGLFTKYLVASEPLYLLDWDINSISKTKSNFPRPFQNRLCEYFLTNPKDLISESTYKLPERQFGFILAWDIIPYMNEKSLAILLKNISKLLRPGGAFIFNFNNCKKLKPSEFYDQRQSAYQTVEYFAHKLDPLSMHIVATNDTNDFTDWLEVHLHGELTTVKRSATRGELLNKSS
jgi:SAM-dependent methyltransferase